MTNDSTATTPGGDQANTLDYALTYARAGVRVVPLRPKAKAPAIADWPNQASTDTSTVRGWFTGSNATRNVGLAMGAWAGSPATYLVCIDLDRHHADRDGVAAWQQIVADNGGDQGQPFTQHTASGGLHLVYQVPVPVTNSLGALPAGVGIDVRGDGGQVMAEPSVHPNGRSPKWAYQANWAGNTPGLAPQWLLDLLTARPAPAEPRPEPTTPPSLRVIEGGDSAGDRPGDRYNATHTWQQVLTGDGWQHSHSSGPDEYWVRPGKSVRDGHSAVLHTAEGAHGVLVVFTTECPPGLRRPENLTSDGNAYKVASPWAYLVATQHNGDHSAAASDRAAASRQADSDRLTALITAPSQPVLDTAADSAPGDSAPGDSAPAPGHTYRLRSLAELIGQPDNPTLPTLLLAEGSDLGVMYRGETNLIAGPSGSGKTWALIVAVLQQARLGRHAVVLDYEMTLRQWYRRARLLGATDSELALIHHCRPSEPTLRHEVWVAMRDQVLAVADQGELAVIALDGVTVALATDGLNANHNDEVARWWQVVPDYLARQTGAGVIIADHTPKHTEPGKAGPIGAQHKVSATSGSVLMAEVRSQMAREPELRNLHLHLRCVKDRHGELGQGDTRHELIVQPAHTGTYVWGVHLMQARDLTATYRDSVLRAVADLATVGEPGTIRQVANLAGLDKDRARRILGELATQGLVQQTGTKHSHNWRLAPGKGDTLDY